MHRLYGFALLTSSLLFQPSSDVQSGLASEVSRPTSVEACLQFLFAASFDGGESVGSLEPFSASECLASTVDEIAQRRHPTYGDYFGMTSLSDGTFRVLRPQMREGRAVLLTTTITATGSVNQTGAKKRDADDAAKLIEVLRIRPGSTVADVGAGDGALEPALSRAIGAEGRLYATDISADRLADIRKVIASESLSNVTVLQGATAETNLPAACCDAIFMRLVYHAIGDPPAMNASLLRSLKPGGRLAVLAFRPESGVSAAPGKRSEANSRGVMPATVVEELTAAGFADVQEVPWPSPPTFAVVAQRPEK